MLQLVYAVEVQAPESCRVPTQSVAEAPKETTHDIAITPVADEVDAGISEKVDAIEEEATTGAVCLVWLCQCHFRSGHTRIRTDVE